MCQTGAFAQFQYNSRDLMLVVRTDAASGSDLEVNLGQISNILSVPAGGTINFSSAFSALQFNTATTAGSPANLSFAVIGGDPVGDGNTSFTDRTLFLTSPRLSFNIQTDPWTRSSPSTQGAALSTILGVGNNLKTWSAGTPNDPVNNTTTAVIISSGDANSYTSIAGSNGDLGGNFGQGNIDNTAASGGNGILRSDFYQITPGSGNGTYLGSFDLNTANGTLSFTAVPEPTTNAILGLGCVAFAFRYIRRFKNQ
ncbi:MAG: hypothetical protein JWN25_2513 [Verrucomicrobiales bacterium]|nr:hypothetical protein [Verrucomicrobiales bacterium]